MRQRVSWALVLGLAGCGSYAEETGGTGRVDVPETYAESTGDESLVRADAPSAELPADAAAEASVEWQWWRGLGDDSLSDAVALAVEQNADIAVAMARIEQARAISDQARAARMPTVGFRAGLTRSGGIQFGSSTTSDNASISIPVRYEVDLYARRARDHRATRRDAEAVEWDGRALALGVAAQTAEAWFDLIRVREERALRTAQLELSREFLTLVELRFERGLTAIVDVHQQRLQVAGLEAQIELFDAQERVLRNQIAVLVGMRPGDAPAPSAAVLPEVGPGPEPGAPAELVARRPDIMAAHVRLAAADDRAATAITSLLPTLTLDGSVGYQWQRFDGGAISMFAPDGWNGGFQWSIGATAEVALFDGLAGAAGVRTRRADVRAAILTYERTLLMALVEVENAIALERQQRIQLTHLERQAEIADATLESARERYSAGLSDYLPVLSSLQTSQDLAAQRLAARRQLLSYRIQLHRALGGGFPVNAAGEAGDEDE